MLVIPLHSAGITPSKLLPNSAIYATLSRLPSSPGNVPVKPECVTVVSPVTASVVVCLLACKYSTLRFVSPFSAAGMLPDN